MLALIWEGLCHANKEKFLMYKCTRVHGEYIVFFSLLLHVPVGRSNSSASWRIFQYTEKH